MTTAAIPFALSAADAARQAGAFAVLADPTRVRLLHAVAVAPHPPTAAELSALLEVDRSACVDHLRGLATAGLVRLAGDGATTRVTIAAGALTTPPHPADALLGLLACGPRRQAPAPSDVETRALRDEDWPAVLRILGEGIDSGDATFETTLPTPATLDAQWLAGHRWAAVRDGVVVGWAAARPVSSRPCYAGVVETSVYVAAHQRGRGVGRALLSRQVTAADEGGLWTLQTSIFPENRASLALHHRAGFRTLAVRERIACHHGVWRDTVLLERRRADDPAVEPGPAQS